MSTKPTSPNFDALYAELAALPENRVGEIIEGVLYSFPRPALPHSLAASAIGAQVFTCFHGNGGGTPDKPGGWIILDEPELHIAGNVLVPDLAGWRRQRMPEVPNAAYAQLYPDWVCEVLSPSTRRHDLLRKLPRYAAMGVSHVWLVDPAAKCIDVFALPEPPVSGARYELVATHVSHERFAEERTGGDGYTADPAMEVKAAIVPFEPVRLDLSLLWNA